MTETGGANVASASDQPGRPYYESLRTSLRSTLAKKRQLDDQLAALEDQIYKAEGNYLEETNGAGNIVRGFDNWVKGVVVGTEKRVPDERRLKRIRDEDRIFSRSSMSWMRSQDSDVPTSATNTPSHAPTPTGSVPPAPASKDSANATPTSAAPKTANKKKKVVDDDDDKSVKRGKISYG